MRISRASFRTFFCMHQRIKKRRFSEKLHEEQMKIKKEYSLKAGDMAVALPGEYHNLKAETKVAVVYIVIIGKYNPKTHHIKLKKSF